MSTDHPAQSPSDGERADLPGLDTRYILRNKQTEGRFSLIEHTIPPRALAAIQARYGLTMDVDSIGPLSERFGLRA